MLPTKGTNKRGRPKRKLEEEGLSSDQFTKKKQSKKALKSVAASKKATEGEKVKKKKKLTKSKPELSDSSDSDQSENNQMKEQVVVKVINIPIQMFMPDKKFAQILNKANKQPQFLIMLRNLLSGCSRLLRDKKIFLHKKWQTLRRSNCIQDEYLSREAELKRMEVEDIQQIERDIMSKLSYANIKGFQLRENFVNDFRHSQIDPLTKISKLEPDTEYVVEEQTWIKYHDLQKKLLNLLMNEKDLVYSNSVDPIRNNQPMPHMRDKMVVEETEMDQKINTIETEENPQATQFLFAKFFAEVNYEKVFENQSNPFKLHQNDIFYMDPKALSWILELKSDQIYTNEKFQAQTFKRYTGMLNHIYKHSNSMPDSQLLEQLLEIAAYLLNSVHYYQKFKLKCDLLHPLDLLLVIEKIKKERKVKETGMMDQTFEKQMQVIVESLEGVVQPMVQE